MRNYALKQAKEAPLPYLAVVASNSVLQFKPSGKLSKPSVSKHEAMLYDAVIAVGLVLILCVPLVLAAAITGS